eukprot:GHVU01029368.1.p2 GENE.GHVU01029368.1~~GHVU01029368.1.p2  ORF type:complete len:125 (+),score=10.27 GHVU01029368.1:267-641(+)
MLCGACPRVGAGGRQRPGSAAEAIAAALILAAGDQVVEEDVCGGRRQRQLPRDMHVVEDDDAGDVHLCSECGTGNGRSPWEQCFICQALLHGHCGSSAHGLFLCPSCRHAQGGALTLARRRRVG